MSERQRKLEDLVKRDAETRVSKHGVGLYEITTTSQPIEPPRIEPGDPPVSLVDDPLPRVRQRLDDILAGVRAIRSEPNNYSQSVRGNAERCSTIATLLVIDMRQMTDSSMHSAAFVAQVMERYADLTEEWHMLKVNGCLEKPVRAREKQLKVLPNKPSVTDDQIRAALSSHKTKKDAAATLGLSERQLRERRKRL